MSVPPILILASTSPRRRQLLTQWGYAHEALSPTIDDGQLAPGKVSAAAWVASLAHLKARSVWDTLDHSRRSRSVIIAADTVVHKNAEILGQPRDHTDARRIVQTLINGSHRVLTGMFILSQAQRSWLVDASNVTVGRVTRNQIDDYIESGHWQGKAGGYNLHERIRDGWPIEYDGDDTSIMGLPMARLTMELRRFGITQSEVERA